MDYQTQIKNISSKIATYYDALNELDQKNFVLLLNTDLYSTDDYDRIHRLSKSVRDSIMAEREYLDKIIAQYFVDKSKGKSL